MYVIDIFLQQTDKTVLPQIIQADRRDGTDCQNGNQFWGTIHSFITPHSSIHIYYFIHTFKLWYVRFPYSYDRVFGVCVLMFFLNNL